MQARTPTGPVRILHQVRRTEGPGEGRQASRLGRLQAVNRMVDSVWSDRETAQARGRSMNIREVPGFDDRLLVCSFGHDHATHPVVGSFHDKLSGGKRPLPSFHCPSCGMRANSRSRSENWREGPSIGRAMELGNVLPCQLCFKDLHDFLMAFFRDRAGRPS
jgi:hypothetical protein